MPKITINHIYKEVETIWSSPVVTSLMRSSIINRVNKPVVTSTSPFFAFFLRNIETNYFELQTYLFFSIWMSPSTLTMRHRISKIYLVFPFYRKKDMFWQIKIGCNYYFNSKTIFTYLHIWQIQTAFIILTTRTVVIKYLGDATWSIQLQKMVSVMLFQTCLLTGLAAITVTYFVWFFHWLE